MASDSTGFDVLIKSLKDQGVKQIFGVVGIPIAEVAVFAQQNGIQFIGMRNEQAACYAAQAMGYLTGRPGVCLVVPGPGLLHTIGGIANAKENSWPLCIIAGASESDHDQMGGFQECHQVEVCRPFCKFSARPPSIETIPYHVQQAFKSSIYGRPGPVYLDFPGDMLRSSVNTVDITYYPCVPEPPRMLAPLKSIKEAITLLLKASSPLVIIGKGAGYARAEDNIRAFLRKTGLPFLPTPMGKGVESDNDFQCMSATRTKALIEADVILLLGAKLNWILHFGRPPRFRSDVKIIQVDICPEEFHKSIPTTVSLLGDLKSVSQQLLDNIPGRFLNVDSWFKKLKENSNENIAQSLALARDDSVPLNYYVIYHNLQKMLPPNCFFVSEGANTMDIGRAFLMNEQPRMRLDAGTYGTMGVGMGYAIAAAFWAQEHSPKTRVVCIQGDSAFGFATMEIETVYRYQLPIIFIIFNNNGIYSGLDGETFKAITDSSDRAITIPPTCLLPNIRYEKLLCMFGDPGHYCETIPELKTAVNIAFSKMQPTIINIAINPSSQRKAQAYDWLTKSKL